MKERHTFKARMSCVRNLDHQRDYDWRLVQHTYHPPRSPFLVTLRTDVNRITVLTDCAARYHVYHGGATPNFPCLARSDDIQSIQYVYE